MKEIVREYGHTVITMMGTYSMVKIMEYLFLGRNGLAEILFKIYA